MQNMGGAALNTVLAVAAVLLSAIPAEAQQYYAATAKKIFAPKPRYPTDEYGRHLTGSGVVLMEVDTETGQVISARMEKSTGHKILDDAAIEAFRKWRFMPRRTPKEVRAPIAFTHSANTR